jgi:hypothetical protein
VRAVIALPVAVIAAAAAAAAAVGGGAGAGCGGPRAAPPIGHRAEEPAAAPRRTLVALVRDGERLAIAAVTDDRVSVLLEDEHAGDVVGWLDERTLIAVATAYGESAVTVSRFVDARRTETITIPATEWPRPAFVELILVGHREIWLSKCVFPPGSNECADRRAYLRVSPGPRIAATAPPPRGERERATNDAWTTWPPPPAAAPVPGFELKIDEGQLALCLRDGGGLSAYPQPQYRDGNFELRPLAMRWVSARPPLYELVADEKNPAGYVHRLRRYFRPCEREPLDGYAFLGGDRWAELKGATQYGETGTWTFHRGEAAIGTLEGIARLRPNLP